MSEIRPPEVARLTLAHLSPLTGHPWMKEDTSENRRNTACRFIEKLEEASAALASLATILGGSEVAPRSEEVVYGAIRLLDALLVFAELEAGGGLRELPAGFNPLGFGELEEAPTFGCLSYHLMTNYIYTLEALAEQREVAHA
jgi:hypothetical protein